MDLSSLSLACQLTLATFALKFLEPRDLKLLKLSQGYILEKVFSRIFSTKSKISDSLEYNAHKYFEQSRQRKTFLHQLSVRTRKTRNI